MNTKMTYAEVAEDGTGRFHHRAATFETESSPPKGTP
jgi:hypothetical protein